jgi:ABC-type transport system involved in multi-copper enzyme maturation permease subunit
MSGPSQMSTIVTIFNVAFIRFILLIRQRLGWMSFLVGVGLVFLSLITAQVSFVNPAKIFWDFGHSVLFVLQSLLSIYLGSQIFTDEKNRRTLHLVLSCGVSRLGWFTGNLLGIWLAILAMLSFWFILLALTSTLVFGSYPWLISFQATILMWVESAVVLVLGFFISLFVRPLIALLATGILVLFLHSLTSLHLIFSDKQVGAYIETDGAGFVLFLARFLPPLEWLDIKMFIGFEDQIAWGQFCFLLLSGFIWTFILAIVSQLKFRRMDL